MDTVTIVALITAISALLVSLFQECRKSRCSEVDICNCIHLKREVIDDVPV